MDETSSSYPDNISSFGYGRQFQTIGKWTILLWMSKIAHVFFGKQWYSRHFTKCRGTPVCPESFQVGASGSPTACHEDLGEDGASHVCLRLESDIIDPSHQKFRRFCSARMRPYIVLDGITSLNTINTLSFFKISFLERVTGWNPKRFPPTDPFRHQDSLVARKVKARGKTPQVSHVCTRFT